MKKYLEAGKIVNTHGVKGHVRIMSWCDTPEALAAIKTLYLESKGEYLPLEIESAVIHKGLVLAKPKGSESFEDAVKYKNRTVYADRDDIALEEGAHFIEDLIGLTVYNAESGKKYGTLGGVTNSGASDIYEVVTENSTVLIPAVNEFVKEIDLEKGIALLPIEGMFDEI